MCVLGYAGHQPVEQLAALPGPAGRRPRSTRRPRSRDRAGRRRSAAPARPARAGARPASRPGRPRRSSRSRRGADRVPCSAHSSVDLPDPLRPIRAMTARRGGAVDAPARPTCTVDDGQSRPAEYRLAIGPRRCGSAGVAGAQCRAADAARRGPSTAVGTSQQSGRADDRRHDGEWPARRPGRPTSHRPSPVSSTIRSANGTTRSSRCSAITTETPEVVDQPGQSGQHLLGRRRVERGGRLVEHQHPRVHGQHRADGHPLLLAARQRAQVADAQRGDAEQVEGLLDPAAHRLAGRARAAPCRRRAPPRRCR